MCMLLLSSLGPHANMTRLLSFLTGSFPLLLHISPHSLFLAHLSEISLIFTTSKVTETVRVFIAMHKLHHGDEKLILLFLNRLIIILLLLPLLILNLDQISMFTSHRHKKMNRLKLFVSE